MLVHRLRAVLYDERKVAGKRTAVVVVFVVSFDGMILGWPSTVCVVCMLSSATVAIRISNPTAIPKIFKPHSARSLS